MKIVFYLWNSIDAYLYKNWGLLESCLNTILYYVEYKSNLFR